MLAFSCKPTSKKQENLDNQSQYPYIVDSLGVQNLFDKTKWALYCIYSDNLLQFHYHSNKDSITLGELDLRLDTLITTDSTVEINLCFFYNDTTPCNSTLIRNMVAWGAVYRKGSDSILCYSGTSTARYFMYSCRDIKHCSDRFVIPLQPEVVKYIQKNRSKLNPWFRKEAVKRGIIKE